MTGQLSWPILMHFITLFTSRGILKLAGSFGADEKVTRASRDRDKNASCELSGTYQRYRVGDDTAYFIM